MLVQLPSWRITIAPLLSCSRASLEGTLPPSFGVRNDGLRCHYHKGGYIAGAQADIIPYILSTTVSTLGLEK
jgi:hypothetical protein